MVSEMEYDGSRNTSPVKCAWCNDSVISYAGRKVILNENDALDYDWACPKCYEKVRYGEI